MTNTINKVIQNGTEYLVGWVTSVNWQQWAVTVEPWITKIFELASTSDLTTAQDAYDWYVNGWNPIIKSWYIYYALWFISSTTARFYKISAFGVTTGWARLTADGLTLTISSWTITAISAVTNTINVQSTVPTSWNNSTITLVI